MAGSRQWKRQSVVGGKPVFRAWKWPVVSGELSVGGEMSG